MKNILQSASKLVFILLTLGAVIGFFIGRLEAKDFMLLAAMAFSFYFSKAPDPTSPIDPATGTPVVGK